LGWVDLEDLSTLPFKAVALLWAIFIFIFFVGESEKKKKKNWIF
jgi:hypothetical protein